MSNNVYVARDIKVNSTKAQCKLTRMAMNRIELSEIYRQMHCLICYTSYVCDNKLIELRNIIPLDRKQRAVNFNVLGPNAGK